MRHGRGAVLRRPLPPSSTGVFRFIGTPSDLTPPTPNITVAPSASRISRVAGKDTTTFSFASDEDYQAYKLKVVPGDSSPHTAGTEIESGGGGSGGVDRAVDVSDDELVAALGTEGVNIVKVFVQDLAGNWSL